MKPDSTVLFDALRALQKQQFIRVIDIRFSHWIAQKIPAATQIQLLLSSLVSQQLGEGHVCIALNNLPDIYQHWPRAQRDILHSILSTQLDSDQLIDQVLIGDGRVITPLVLDNQRLYLYRYWQYEKQVAQRLIESSSISGPQIDSLVLKAQLDKYFGEPAQQIDWQRIAAAITTRHSISVISGGPGTGKTTTVTKLLAIYIESCLTAGKRPIIQLAAPTGKAAARLSESIAQAKQKLALSDEVKALIPDQGKTLHRLLGVRAGSKKFIHHQDNPLLLDLLVIDEASMIDLPMMASIVNALAQGTKLVLIGDRDQLASVEAGSVMGDICAVPKVASYSKSQQDFLAASCQLMQGEPSVHPFSDQVAFLQKSYRFDENSGIGALANACNNGDTKQLTQVLAADYQDLAVIVPSQDSGQILQASLQGYRDYIAQMRATASPAKLLESFNQFQILCALRVGNFGVEQVNGQIEQHFERCQLKSADNRWYLGRPIMITQNDNQMQLYNGDIGVACTDPDTGQLKVWFEQGGQLRAVLPSRLPKHETVFAMTVHKSQGSEFSHVMLILAQSAKVINRELVYTAVTRAKHKFSLLGFEKLLQQAIKQVTLRTSGLAARIWRESEN